MQSDFATTDAQEAAELDDGCLDLSGSIYHDINDPPHVQPPSAFDHSLAPRYPSPDQITRVKIRPAWIAERLVRA
jgi:hypothetical protein